MVRTSSSPHRVIRSLPSICDDDEVGVVVNEHVLLVCDELEVALYIAARRSALVASHSESRTSANMLLEARTSLYRAASWRRPHS